MARTHKWRNVVAQDAHMRNSAGPMGSGKMNKHKKDFLLDEYDPFSGPRKFNGVMEGYDCALVMKGRGYWRIDLKDSDESVSAQIFEKDGSYIVEVDTVNKQNDAYCADDAYYRDVILTIFEKVSLLCS